MYNKQLYLKYITYYKKDGSFIPKLAMFYMLWEFMVWKIEK